MKVKFSNYILKLQHTYESKLKEKIIELDKIYNKNSAKVRSSSRNSDNNMSKNNNNNKAKSGRLSTLTQAKSINNLMHDGMSSTGNFQFSNFARSFIGIENSNKKKRTKSGNGRISSTVHHSGSNTRNNGSILQPNRSAF